MRLTAILIFICNSAVFGQNLVPNAGFEEMNDTISGFTHGKEFITKIKYWITPNTATPDIITPDFEEAFVAPPEPHSGLMMAGIQSQIHWSECIGVKLSKPLIPNRTYYVEYWIRRANCINPKMDDDRIIDKNFGILFSSELPQSSDGTMLFGSPQIHIDTQLLITNREWIKISGFFTPKTTYSHLYLGQFRQKNEAPYNMRGYFVIDDILVKEITDIELLTLGKALPVGSIIPLDNITFISGTTDLKDAKSYNLLKNITTYLKANPSIRIRINGHTDSVGSKKSNLTLSNRRAQFIAQEIIQNGIDEKRINWKGFGETYPIADNRSAEGRAQNRRVEFEIVE
jgi:outer membrane protein OmpA-like peptidoglycan-associated protein